MSEQTCCDKNMGEPFTCGQLSQEVRHLQQRIAELEQELAESRQSNKDFCETVTLQLSRLAELESSYAGAVEVDAQVRSVSYRESGIPIKSYIESPRFNQFIGRRVKVLVMPMEVE